MRTPPGFSICNLAWPRKVIAPVPSGSAAANRTAPCRAATTPVHAACATEAISKAKTSAPLISRPPILVIPAQAGTQGSPLLRRGLWAPAFAGRRRLSEHNLDQKWAGRGDALGKAVVEGFHRRNPRAGDAHRPCQTDPVQVGVPEIEHVERLAAGITGADIGELAFEDRVAAV